MRKNCAQRVILERMSFGYHYTFLHTSTSTSNFAVDCWRVFHTLIHFLMLVTTDLSKIFFASLQGLMMGFSHNPQQLLRIAANL